MPYADEETRKEFNRKRMANKRAIAQGKAAPYPELIKDYTPPAQEPEPEPRPVPISAPAPARPEPVQANPVRWQEPDPEPAQEEEPAELVLKSPEPKPAKKPEPEPERKPEPPPRREGMYVESGFGRLFNPASIAEAVLKRMNGDGVHGGIILLKFTDGRESIQILRDPRMKGSGKVIPGVPEIILSGNWESDPWDKEEILKIIETIGD